MKATSFIFNNQKGGVVLPPLFLNPEQMKKLLFILSIVCILFTSCAESKWPSRVKDGGSCPQNRGMIGMGGNHAPGMRW